MYADLVYSSPSVATATAAAVVAQTFCDAKTDDDDGIVGVPCVTYSSSLERKFL